MPLTLALSDNSNPTTGFTAAVAGSSGATVSVWYTPADRPWPGDAWVLAGTRIGDGSLIVAVPPRFYFVYVSVAGAASPPERVAVTTGLDEDATRIGSSIAATLSLLALPSRSDYLAVPRRTPASYGWVGINVYDHLREDWTDRKYPCFEITLEGSTEGQENGTNGADDIVYPFKVMLFDSTIAETRHDHKPWVQYVRAKVSKSFRNQHLMGMKSSVVTRIEPMSIFRRLPEDGTRPRNMYAGGFVLRCVNRERRGLGA